jgi:hypothetical protein
MCCGIPSALLQNSMTNKRDRETKRRERDRRGRERQGKEGENERRRDGSRKRVTGRWSQHSSILVCHIAIVF